MILNLDENAKAREHARKEANDQKDDWSGITDREERRRIQNRIAQRKFRKFTSEFILTTTNVLGFPRRQGQRTKSSRRKSN